MKVTINGQTLECRHGQTILNVARENGIEIPTLCYHPDLSLDGSCRLCTVEVEGRSAPVAACVQPATDGMSVRTESPDLTMSRTLTLELLLSRYNEAAQAESVAGPETEFEQWARHYGLQIPASPAEHGRYHVDSDPNPVIRVDLNKCILCTRCIRACDEVQGRFVWDLAKRGDNTKLIAGTDTTMLDARCESCGACVAYCPTGALEDRRSFGIDAPDQIVQSVCTYCGVGCGIDLHITDNQITRVTGNGVINGKHLCVKGRYGYDFVHHPDRLTRPMVREHVLRGETRGRGTPRGEWVEVDWDTALNAVVDNLVNAKNQGGPDAVGFLASAKCTNEENYLLQKLARQIIGTHNVDHCARLCHSSSVAALQASVGSGAMSNTMDDLADQAAAYFVIGANVTEQHPVFGSRLRQAVLRRGAKLIVADPRRIDITEFATLHLRQKPGTDTALLNGIMHIIIANNWHDKTYIGERTEGFEDLRRTLEEYTPESVSKITGVPVDDLYQAAEIMGNSRPAAAIWGMGITQHIYGVINALSLVNLQMLTGNVGVPGGGLNPLRGQNNVQGACDMGALPDVFPGYQKVISSEAREKFANAWELQPATLPLADHPGLTVTEMVDGTGSRSIKALFVLAENPLMSDPNINHVRECMEAAEFVAVQEIFPSETSHYADVLLPGVSWAEKQGTFANTDRLIQMVRPAVENHSDARADWEIITELGKRILEREERTPVGPQSGWDYTHPSDVMSEIAALTPSHTGITYERIEMGEALRWPVPALDHPGTPVLHIGKFTSGLGNFHVCEHLPPDEIPDSDYPFFLTTGRVLYHWHGAEMTRRSQGLIETYPKTLVEVNPADASRMGIGPESNLRVISRRGEMQAGALISERVPEGVVFGNFHFPGSNNVNNVTNNALDPVSKIPEYKLCAVRVELCESVTPHTQVAD
jgi:formate dehydrogenase alpha subunit